MAQMSQNDSNERGVSGSEKQNFVNTHNIKIGMEENISSEPASKFYNSEHMKSKEFLDGMIKQQQDRYAKKFAFEKGQFHQCIPNPKKEN